MIEKADFTLSVSEKKMNEYNICISEKVKYNSKKYMSNATKELTKRVKLASMGSSSSLHSTSLGKNKDNKCNNIEDNYLITIFLI